MKSYTVEVYEQPSEAVVSIAEIKNFLRVSTDLDDDLLASLVEASTQYVQNSSDVQLVKAGFRLVMTGFYWRNCWLPWKPFSDLVSIKYYDSGNVLQTLPSTYYQVSSTTQGFIRGTPGTSFPCTFDRLDSVEIKYRAGFASASEVPKHAVAAVRLLAGHLYENREATTEKNLKDLPLGIHALIESFKNWSV